MDVSVFCCYNPNGSLNASGLACRLPSVVVPTRSPGGNEYEPGQCVPCPDTYNGSALAGATSVAECGSGCKPGFADPTTGCRPCPHDTFSRGALVSVVLHVSTYM